MYIEISWKKCGKDNNILNYIFIGILGMIFFRDENLELGYDI